MNTPSQAPLALWERIDVYANALGAKTCARLSPLSEVPEPVLERIMFEAWQVSVHNPPILAAARERTKVLAEEGISAEMQENLDEETGHDELYRKGIDAIGSDTSSRTPWPASDALFKRIFDIMEEDASMTLGAMYASESIALFESQLLLEVAEEVIRRRGVQDRGRGVVNFHKMHLSGVEQGHKDGLGIFLESDKGEGEARVDQDKVWAGAVGAIDAIGAWWDALIAPIE